MACLVGRSHRELVIVELAEHHRAGRPEISGDRRLVGWGETVKNVRAGCGLHPLGGEQILDAKRNAFKRARLAFGNAPIALLGTFQRALRRSEYVSIQRLVRALDRVDMRARKLFGGELLAGKRLARLGNRKIGGIGHALYGLTVSHLTKAL